MGQKVILFLVIGLTGCQSVGLTSSFCDPRSGIGPIRLTAEERAVLRAEVKADILVINKYGQANCKWKP